jgi:BMFP domain-containing protein YqiC
MWYLTSAFDAYQKMQETVQNRLGDVQSAILSPLDMMKKFLVPPPSPELKSDDLELHALRTRVAELEAQMKESAGTSQSRRRKTPRNRQR